MLFLITARGGSKGLPGKNLAAVGGIPLVARSVRLARRSLDALDLKGRVVCSTDSAEIAQAARQWGAEVPFMRPASLATDSASSMDVIAHALGEMGEDPETLVLLQPTSPLTEPEDVLAAVRLHHERGVCVVSVVEAAHPIGWTYRLGGNHALSPASGAGKVARRQDAETFVRLNGAVYVARTSWLREHNTFLGEGTLGLRMPQERSVDVDSAFDLEVARALLTCRPVTPVRIGHRFVGPGHPCFVVADAGASHDGSLDLALGIVDAAADARADAVVLDLSGRHELEERAQAALLDHCARRGVVLLSSPIDAASCDLLDRRGLPAFWIPSGKLTELAFLRHVARKDKPLIVSTAGVPLDVTAAAVDAVRAQRSLPLVLIHASTQSTAEAAGANLPAVATLQAAFGVPAGFSDQTTDDAMALAAVARGACLIKKPLTSDFAALVGRLRAVEAALGRQAEVHGS
jgi:CMP-N,N'-diacetyllegionaminic acid synthase